MTFFFSFLSPRTPGFLFYIHFILMPQNGFPHVS